MHTRYPQKWNIFENIATIKRYLFANIYQPQFESHQLHQVLKIEDPYDAIVM